MAKALLRALPLESQQEIERMTLEDQHRAQEEVVELRSEEGALSYKHLEQLVPEDRQDRMRAELRRLEWLLERQTKRNMLLRLGIILRPSPPDKG